MRTQKANTDRHLQYLYYNTRYNVLEYLRPEISALLKFQFAFGIWCFSVIFSWVLVQFLQGGGAGGWGVILFKELLRCMLILLFKIYVAYMFEINI